MFTVHIGSRVYRHFNKHRQKCTEKAFVLKGALNKSLRLFDKKNNSLLINLLKINMSEQQFVEATMFPNISIYNLLKCPIHPFSFHRVAGGGAVSQLSY